MKVMMLIMILVMCSNNGINNDTHNDDNDNDNHSECLQYGQFSEFQICFCGLDPGNLKFETVRANRQRMCFQDLRRSI